MITKARTVEIYVTMREVVLGDIDGVKVLRLDLR